MRMKTFRDLIIWQKSMELVVKIYQTTADFPRNEEFGLKSQMRRAVVSIPSNIAEGQSRNHEKEFVQFLHVALGSLSELETQIELSERLNLLALPKAQKTLDTCSEIGKMLHGLCNALKAKKDGPSSTDR
jgi:four helix bundle protein